VVGIRGNFEGARNRVIEGWFRGGGRKLCKEKVGWIVDLNTFLVDLYETMNFCSVFNNFSFNANSFSLFAVISTRINES